MALLLRRLRTIFSSEVFGAPETGSCLTLEGWRALRSHCVEKRPSLELSSDLAEVYTKFQTLSRVSPNCDSKKTSTPMNEKKNRTKGWVGGKKKKIPNTSNRYSSL